MMFVSQSNVLDRAVDWIFSHLDDLESMDVSEGGRSAAESEGGRDPPPGPRVRDGPGSESYKEKDERGGILLSAMKI